LGGGCGGRFLRLLRQERGTASPEFLVLTAGAAFLAYLVARAVLPALQQSHATALNRITNIGGSGY
jgi:hypothetical protein